MAKSTLSVQIYEVTWKSGATEKIEAHTVNYGGHAATPMVGAGCDSSNHIRFYGYSGSGGFGGLLLSINGSEVKSVRLVTEPVLVKKRWGSMEVEAEQRWFDRAKELIETHGRYSVEPVKILAQEMGLTLHGKDNGGLTYRIMAIANSELVSKHHCLSCFCH